ncbi:hypothetical protein CEK62_15420 [Alcanivorax sp. N3-2A]|nr:hypothetical protein CEK62_15420 [Alcanivorax sp. N3-2A]|tara:strand:- start:25419 stop:26231 length:813 start_codon:yes stop_codon:yes gene_type:complete
MADAKNKSRPTKSRSGEINGTKLELTLAAEKVFAMNGLRGATLRQIREEAGQKNESVIHYHFGSREAIIESILNLRSNPIDAERLAMLAELRSKNNGLPLSSMVIAETCIMPLARYVLDNDEPGYYLRFLVQLRMDRNAWRRFNGLHGEGSQNSRKALHEAKPYMPVAILDQRYVSMQYMHINGLAAIEQVKSEKKGGFRLDEGWIRVDDMITTAAAIFDAPLSPSTLAAIQEADARHAMPTYMGVAMDQQRSWQPAPVRSAAEDEKAGA